jgi:Zn-dependent protease with chaperone function
LVVVVFISLLAFLILSLALIGAAGYLIWLLKGLIRTKESEQGALILLPIGLAFALMFLIFLLKGLFRRRPRRTDCVEVREADQPELFHFIRLLCEETQAPLPKRVYVNHDVNAAVFYRQSLLNLILPVRKNLLVGLGLVNVLSLTEFKAVLAHEFGHFAQRSMKLGHYVYVINPIITNMVYARDRWDRFLYRWCHLPLPIISSHTVVIYLAIVAPGWLLYGVVTLFRKILSGLFRAINWGSLALTREMEFNADRVAVSVTGSDAPIHVLVRLPFAEQALRQAARDLFAAADHKLFTRDLFLHQTHAAEFMRRLRKTPGVGIPPALPDDPHEQAQVFQPDDKEVPSMWATHPSNYLREQNAKRFYIRSLPDDRPAWLAFRNPEEIRQQVTCWFYREILNRPCDPESLTDAAAVQWFIDDEHAEMIFDARYHGYYDDYYLSPGDLDGSMRACNDQPQTHDQVLAAFAQISPPEQPQWMSDYFQRRTESIQLAEISRRPEQSKQSRFDFRGAQHDLGDLQRILGGVRREIQQSHEQHLAPHDQRVFSVHYQMARQLGDGFTDELVGRYRSHLAIQTLMQQVAAQHDQVQGVAAYLGRVERVNAAQWDQILGLLDQARRGFADSLQFASQLQLPPLKNLASGGPLGQFLLSPDAVCPPLRNRKRIEGKWIGEFLQQFGQVRERLNRFHFKSLGSLLSLQERIAADWQREFAQAAIATAQPLPTDP